MGKSKKKKKVSLPKTDKSKKVEKVDLSATKGYPIFLFDRIDKGARESFVFDTAKAEFKHKEFIDKIINYSKMTWHEIEKQTHDNRKTKHHYLSDLSKVSADALKRLEEMRLDDMTEYLYSMSFGNKLRIIGLRDGDCFHILWYDQEHEVCPSQKGHT